MNKKLDGDDNMMKLQRSSFKQAALGRLVERSKQITGYKKDNQKLTPCKNKEILNWFN